MEREKEKKGKYERRKMKQNDIFYQESSMTKLNKNKMTPEKEGNPNSEKKSKKKGGNKKKGGWEAQ